MRILDASKFIRFLLLLSCTVCSIASQAKAQELGNLLRDSKKFVVQIVAKSASYETYGTAILVDAGNQGTVFITNLHVVSGASSVKAIPAIDSSKTIALEPIAIWPEYDLAALIAKGRPANMTPAAFASLMPAEGDAVFAIGYPAGLGYTINGGMVTGMRVFKDLPQELQGGRPLAASSPWIQTNLPVDARNSGGPLLNNKNELIGINTFGSANINQGNVNDIEASFQNRGMLFALPFNSIQSLLANIDNARVTSLIQTNTASKDKFVRLNVKSGGEIGYLKLLGPPGAEVIIATESGKNHSRHDQSVGYIPEEGGEVYIAGLWIEKRIYVEFRKPGHVSEYAYFSLSSDTGYSEARWWPGGLKKVPESLSHITIRTIPIDALITVSGATQGTFQKEDPTIMLPGVPGGTYYIRAKRDGVTLDTTFELGQGARAFVDLDFIIQKDDVDTTDVTQRGPFKFGLYSTVPKGSHVKVFRFKNGIQHEVWEKKVSLWYRFHFRNQHHEGYYWTDDTKLDVNIYEIAN